MKLVEKKHIYKPKGDLSWSKTHAQVPFAMEVGEFIRVFFATRDENSQSSVTFIDVDRENPEHIIYTHDKPVFEPGIVGSFDENGTMPSWFLRNGDEIWMYYTAWNKSETASYRLSIGLAISKDDGVSFKRAFDGPLMDRSKNDPIWVGQPCVIKEGEDNWKMWYLSCQKIEIIDNHPEPFYNVKYATSPNGIDWKVTDKVCIDFNESTDAIGRPCVWVEDGKYRMLHSNRMAKGYREMKDKSYRIEYSESTDGVKWVRMSNVIDFKKSESGWDSIMNEYCTVFKNKDHLNVLYNGNGFGESGFGVAKFEL